MYGGIIKFSITIQVVADSLDQFKEAEDILKARLLRGVPNKELRLIGNHRVKVVETKLKSE